MNIDNSTFQTLDVHLKNPEQSVKVNNILNKTSYFGKTPIENN